MSRVLLVALMMLAVVSTTGCQRTETKTTPAAYTYEGPRETAARTVGCSAADESLISSYSQTAVEALTNGDLSRALEITRQLDKKLSSGCLAKLAQSQPMRTKCSATEKKTAIDHYVAVFEAAVHGDLSRTFQLLEHLEASVSEPCFTALNYPQDA